MKIYTYKCDNCSLIISTSVPQWAVSEKHKVCEECGHPMNLLHHENVVKQVPVARAPQKPES